MGLTSGGFPGTDYTVTGDVPYNSSFAYSQRIEVRAIFFHKDTPVPVAGNRLRPSASASSATVGSASMGSLSNSGTGSPIRGRAGRRIILSKIMLNKTMLNKTLRNRAGLWSLVA